MNKKTYKQPSLKVVQLDNTYIICTSGPSTMSLNEDVGDYGDDERPGVSRDIWGTPW